MTTEGLANLTTGERDVLLLLGQGYDIKACAAELGVTDSAITERLRSARRKLGVTSSRAAARLLRDDPATQYSLSVDSFSGLVGNTVPPPSPSSPAGQAERTTMEAVGGDLREVQLAYNGFGDVPRTLPYVPLRGVGARENSLSKAQRVHAMIDLSIKVAGVAALLCMIALAINMASLS